MPVQVIYEKPEGWPFTVGQTILNLSPGSPPEISYVVDENGTHLRLVATKAAKPTHKVRISNVGGPMGTGHVVKNQQGNLLQPQSGEWATGFFSIAVPDDVDSGLHEVRLDWDNQQTATVEKREREHVADLKRAYEITWKVVEEALQKLQHTKYPIVVAPDSDPKKRVEFRNQMLSVFVDYSDPKAPKLSQDFAENYMESAPFTDKNALHKGLVEYSKDQDYNYERKKFMEAKEVALLQALAGLFAALPKKLQPVGTAQSYEMLKQQAKSHWEQVFTETAQKTQQRDIGFNNEHSGKLEFSHYQNKVIYLKRVPSAKLSTPTDQLINL